MLFLAARNVTESPGIHEAHQNAFYHNYQRLRRYNFNYPTYNPNLSISLSLSLFIPFCLVVYEMSNLLGTGLDRDTLNICSLLLEEGANPEALAALVIELNKESSRS